MTRMLAEVIASAFASGLSWSTSLGGKQVYCPPPDLKGQQVMSAAQRRFLAKPPNERLGGRPRATLPPTKTKFRS